MVQTAQNSEVRFLSKFFEVGGILNITEHFILHLCGILFFSVYLAALL